MIADDQQPEVWVGHIAMDTDQLEESVSFMLALGMRSIFKTADIAILELRAATHLVLVRKDHVEPGEASFDLMVDDLDAVRKWWSADGLGPSDVTSGQVHHSFRITDPSGYEITIYNPHTSDKPV